MERSGVPKESAARSLIRASSDLCLHAATRGVSLLAAPFLSAQAWSSTRRRCMSGLLGLYSNVCLASDNTRISSYYLAYVRLSLRADKSSLHPLLLTGWSGAASFCGDLFDHILIANYLTHNSENISVAIMGGMAFGESKFLSPRCCVVVFGLVSWRTASDFGLRKLRPPC
jgi:hypothetical protein